MLQKLKQKICKVFIQIKHTVSRNMFEVFLVNSKLFFWGLLHVEAPIKGTPWQLNQFLS